MTGDRKASEVEKARLQLPLHRGVGNDCCRIFERNGRSVATVDTPDIGTVIIDLVNRPAVRAEQHDWLCGCGHWNGSNLPLCAACIRKPGATE